MLPVKYTILKYNSKFYWCAEVFNGLPTMLIYVRINEKTKTIDYIENSLKISEMLKFDYDILKAKIDVEITKVWNNPYGLTDSDNLQIIGFALKKNNYAL